MTWRQGAKWTAVLIAALAAILFSGAALFDWRDFIAHRISTSTGRATTIENVEVRPGLNPRFRIEGLRLGNAPWSSRRDMASIRTLEFTIRLWPLLVGRVVIPEMNMIEPEILLEVSEDNRRNWEWDKDGSGGGNRFVIARLLIKDGTVLFRNPTAKTEMRIDLSTLPPAGETREPRIALNGRGRFKGEAFALSGQAGSLLALRNPDDPYFLDLRGRVAQTQVAVKGTMTDPSTMKGLDLALKLKGDDFSKLYPLFGLPLPSSPPYTLEGRLKRKGARWEFENFSGVVGDSDLGGTFAVEIGGVRPAIHADLKSRRLDFDDLAGFVGAPPKTGAGETASREQKQEQAQRARQPRVLPDKPYALSKLRSMDAKVRFRGERIHAPSLPLENLYADLLLEDGRLTFRPLRFGIAGGEIAAHIIMDARNPKIATNLDTTVRGVSLSKLFPRFRPAQTWTGTLGGKARLSTTGNSIARMAATASGELALVMTGGQISNLVLELAGIDAAESLRYFLGGDKNVEIRCAVADFKVDQGVMQPRILVLDTTDTNIIGEGRVDLRTESLDLTLHARPKDRSLLSARAPLFIQGSFKKPDLSVDKAKIARKAATALALGALTPLAALLPLIETGPGQDSPCGELINQARAHADDRSPRRR